MPSIGSPCDRCGAILTTDPHPCGSLSPDYGNGRRWEQRSYPGYARQGEYTPTIPSDADKILAWVRKVGDDEAGFLASGQYRKDAKRLIQERVLAYRAIAAGIHSGDWKK